MILSPWPRKSRDQQETKSPPTLMLDLLQRITYATLKPAAKLAMGQKTSLKELKRQVELAYYHEAKKQGLKGREIQEALSISSSKVGLLSKELKEYFRQPEVEQGIARQLLSLLWATPLTKGRLYQSLPEFDDAEITSALELLIEEGRVREIEGRTLSYELTAQAHRLDTSPWMSRVAGLNSLMNNVTQAIEARFMRDDDRTFVRNVAFRARPEDLERLKKVYEEHLFPLICELDERAVNAEDDEESVQLRLTMLWSAEQDEASNQPEDKKDE